MSALPPIDDPALDGMAAELGKTILWERAQLPPVVLGRCEHAHPYPAGELLRCPENGILVSMNPEVLGGIFLCPRHGATLALAVRRWPR